MKGPELRVLLTAPTSETVWQSIKCHSITKYKAENEVVVVGFELARGLGTKQIDLKSDSRLVNNRLLGTYVA